MKPREPRRRVMIRARMRSGARWGDVAILDISSRGMLIHAPETPPRGAYLEVRRGSHAIIARVVWTNDQRFGVCTQDRLSIEAIIREPDWSASDARQPAQTPAPVERRSVKRRPAGERHERSRIMARAAEFACLAIAGASAALVAFSIVEENFRRPLTDVAAVLAR